MKQFLKRHAKIIARADLAMSYDGHIPGSLEAELRIYTGVRACTEALAGNYGNTAVISAGQHAGSVNDYWKEQIVGAVRRKWISFQSVFGREAIPINKVEEMRQDKIMVESLRDTPSIGGMRSIRVSLSYETPAVGGEIVE